MKNLYKLIILSGMALILGSCYYDTFPEEEVIIPEEVSYSNDIQPLWDQDCVSCHKGNIPPNLEASVSYNSLIQGGYVVPGDAESSTLYLSLIPGSGVSLMPPAADGGPWPAQNVELVKKWINDGAENN